MENFTKYSRRLCHAIKKCRRAAGLTQEQLSERVEVAPSFIAMLETGDRKPSVEMLYRLAAALGVRPSDILRVAEDTATEEAHGDRADTGDIPFASSGE